MPWSFIIPAAASLIGGSMQANAAKSAANAANAQSRYALDKQIELQEPFRQAGITGQNRLMELLGLGGNTGAEGYGKYSRDFNMSDFTQDPGYGFRLKQGQKALDASAAARGGLISGNALKAAQGFGQDMASQEYNNAFNRYQINRTNQLAPLQSLFGAGQTAATTLGGNYGTYGSETGANTGNALMARGNAVGSALSGIGSAYGRNPVSFSSLYGGGGGGGSIGYGSGYAGEGPTGYAP
jgi:hypothetical protein